MQKKENIKYIIYALIFLLFFYAEERLGIRPFAIGMFMALIYSKQNILFLAPIYLICGLAINPSLMQLIYVISPVIIVSVSFLVHYKLKKAVKLLAINLYAFLAQFPLILFETGDTYLLTNTIITILSTQIFTYCSVIIIYAVLVRGLKYKISFEEAIAVSIFSIVIFTALAIMTATYVNIYYAVAIYCILMSVYTGGRNTLYLAVIIGLGGVIAYGDISALGTMVLWAFVALSIKKSPFYIIGLGIILSDIVLNLFFTVDSNYSFYFLFYKVGGILLFAFTPKKIKEFFNEISSDYGARRATRTIINRDRANLAYKIGHLSRLFYEMKDILIKDLSKESITCSNEVVTRDVYLACCAGCANLSSCNNALGGDVTSIVSNLVSSAIDNEKATLLDAPPYLATRCKQINRLIKTANSLSTKFNDDIEKIKNLDKSKLLISEQLGGIGIILNNLKQDISKQVKYDTRREKQLIEALSYNDIIASEVIIYGEKKNIDSVTVIVRESDQESKKILELINLVMGKDLEEYYRENTLNNQVSIHYGIATKFDVVYGEKSVSSTGEVLCGDNKRVVRLTQSNIMVILSDGMGHGKKAFDTSNNIIDMLEHLYKAGFDHNTILTTVNALSSLRSKEDFNAIDIVVIDTITGVADFIKLGGRESFIVREDNIDIIDGGSLPIGILDEVTPVIERKALKSGDFVILATDGVMDNIASDMLVEIIEENLTHNPQILADTIVDNAIRMSNLSKLDDTTCIVLKMFER